MNGSVDSLPYLSLLPACELHWGQDGPHGAAPSMVPGMHSMLGGSGPELLDSSSHAAAYRPMVQLQPGSLSQLLIVILHLSHTIN